MGSGPDGPGGRPDPGDDPHRDDPGDRHGDGAPDGRGGRGGESKGDDGPLSPVDKDLSERERALPGLVERSKAVVAWAAKRDRLFNGPDRPADLRLEDRLVAASWLREAGGLHLALGRYGEGERTLEASRERLVGALDFAKEHFPVGTEKRANAYAELALDDATRQDWESARGGMDAADQLYQAALDRSHADPPGLRAAQGLFWRQFAEAAIDGDDPGRGLDRLDALFRKNWLPGRGEKLLVDRAMFVASMRTGLLAREEISAGSDHLAEEFLGVDAPGQATATRLLVTEHWLDTGETVEGQQELVRASGALASLSRPYRPYARGLLTWFNATVPFELGARKPYRQGMIGALWDLNQATASEAGVLCDALASLGNRTWRSAHRPLRPALSLRRLAELG